MILTLCVTLVSFLYLSIKDNNKYELQAFLILYCLLPIFFSTQVSLQKGFQFIEIFIYLILFFCSFFVTFGLICRNYNQMKRNYAERILIKIGLDKQKRKAFQIHQLFVIFIRLHLITIFVRFYNLQFFVEQKPFHNCEINIIQSILNLFFILICVWGYFAAKYQNKFYMYVWIAVTLIFAILHILKLLIGKDREKEHFSTLVSNGQLVYLIIIVSYVFDVITLLCSIYYGIQCIRMYKYNIKDSLKMKNSISSLNVKKFNKSTFFEKSKENTSIPYSNSYKILYKEGQNEYTF